LATHLADDERFTVVIPDLPGHGRSPREWSYSYGAMAAKVAHEVGGCEGVVVVGHSLGGVIGLVLASGWFGVEVAHVIGIGVKLSWTDEQSEAALIRSGREERTFERHDEALERYLRVSGLQGVVDPATPMAQRGVIRTPQGWRLAWDPRTAAVGATPAESLLAGVPETRRSFLRGSEDIVVAQDDGSEWGVEHEVVGAYSHNIHVEAPGLVFSLIEPKIRPGRDPS
jgi:pimeloyl-ACP methyl ester carboxylesterase